MPPSFLVRAGSEWSRFHGGGLRCPRVALQADLNHAVVKGIWDAFPEVEIIGSNGRIYLYEERPLQIDSGTRVRSVRIPRGDRVDVVLPRLRSAVRSGQEVARAQTDRLAVDSGNALSLPIQGVRVHLRLGRRVDLVHSPTRRE